MFKRIRVNSGKNVRCNQASELAVLLNQRSNGKSIGRLEEIYSNIYFDEVQDLAGYDIEILKLLMIGEDGWDYLIYHLVNYILRNN